MFVRRLHCMVTFAAVWLVCACAALGDARATIEQILALQAQLQKELPGETIRVTESTDGELSVDLVNSRLAELPDDDRALRTRQIAEFVRDHYRRAAAIQTISIVLKSETGAAGFTVSSSQSTDYAMRDLVAVELQTAAALSESTATQPPAPGPVDTVRRGTVAPSGIKSISRWNQ